MSRMSEGEIEREARWILRELEIKGGYLLRRNKMRFVLEPGDALVKRMLVAEFHRRDWLRTRGTTPESYALSDAGLFWLRRQQAEGDPYAAQHQILAQRLIRTDTGEEQMVTVNEGESPLGWLFNRGAIDAVQLEAGEKLRRDFTVAGLTPRMAMDWDRPVVDRVRGPRPEPEMSEMVLAAKQRFSRAMSAAGPVISDLLFDICCHLIGLEAAESARNWPRRTAKIVLSIGLERLAAHYGLRAVHSAGMRGWQAA
jgi:uncharacterized protein DUF6456